MSNDGHKKIELWNGMIEYEAPAPNAGAEAIKASIDEGLIAFERHEKELLDVLSNAYERGPKAEPFDANKAWRHLTSVASHDFHQQWLKQKATKPADRQARLRDMAKALRLAHETISEAMQSDVGNDLLSAWWDMEPAPMRLLLGEDTSLLDIVDLRIFDKAVALLAALETTAQRAADEVTTKRGRPKGTAVLSKDSIAALASIFRESTQLNPGAGEGPFARLCVEFLAALGRRNITDQSVFEAIKDAKVWAQNNKWSSSPFDN